MASQKKKRIQVSTGNPAINSTQNMTLKAGDNRAAGTAETAVTLRIFVAQNNDADGNQHKGEQCADIGKVSEGADIQQSCGERHHKTGDPGGYGGRAKAGMYFAE